MLISRLITALTAALVAVLSNQPQGGFITRKVTPEVRVADDNGWGSDGYFFSPRNWFPGDSARGRGTYYGPPGRR